MQSYQPYYESPVPPPVRKKSKKKARVFCILAGIAVLIAICVWLQFTHKSFEALAKETSLSLADVYIPEEYANTTIPLEYIQDSDNDGYTDIVEMAAGTDPEHRDTFSSSNAVTLDVQQDGMSLHLEGTPNIHKVYYNTVNGINVKNAGALLSPVYEFYLDDFSDNVFNAEVSIAYDTSRVPEDQLDNICLYQYLADGSLVEVEGCTVADGRVTATLKHFSMYVVAFRALTTANDFNKTMVAICIDDSGSMYEGGSDCNHDVDGKRWDFAKQLLSSDLFYNENTSVYLNCFTRTSWSITTLTGMNERNLEAGYAAVDDAMTWHDSKSGYFNGTTIYHAICDGVSACTSNLAGTRYLILLTDGYATDSFSADSCISVLKGTGVIPIIIGLGNDIDITYLQKIADSCGGTYLPLANANAFDLLTERITNSISYTELEVPEVQCHDIVGSNTVKAQTLADCGFDPSVDAQDLINIGWCAGISYETKNNFEGTRSFVGKKYKSYTDKSDLDFKGQLCSDVADIGDIDNPAFHLWKDMFKYHLQQDNQDDYVYDDTTQIMRIPDTVYTQDFMKKILRVDVITVPEGSYYDVNGNNLYDLGIDKEISGYEAVTFDTQALIALVESEDFGSATADEIRELRLIYQYRYWYGYINAAQRWMDGSLTVTSLTDASPQTNPIVEAVMSVSNAFSGWYEQNTCLLYIYDGLKAGRPQELFLSNGVDSVNHAVLCYRMLRDVDNPNIIYLVCCDSNNPKIPLIFTIEFEKLIGYFPTQPNLALPMPISITCNQSLYNYQGIFTIELQDISSIFEPAA